MEGYVLVNVCTIPDAHVSFHPNAQTFTTLRVRCPILSICSCTLLLMCALLFDLMLQLTMFLLPGNVMV